MLVAQSCLTLCDPMDCSLPGFSDNGILQGRILQWVAIPFSRGSSWPRDRTWVSCIAGRFFTIWATRETPYSQLIGREEKKRAKEKERRGKTVSGDFFMCKTVSCLCAQVFRAWVQPFSRHGKLSTWIWLVVGNTDFPEGKGCLISFCFQILTHSLTLTQSQTSTASWLNAHPAGLHFLKHS